MARVEAPKDTLSELTEEERARIQDLGDAIQITLLEPFIYRHSKLDGERTVTELRLVKKVKGRHLKSLDKAEGEIGKTLAMLSAMSGLPIHAMDELDVRDIEVAGVVIEPFLPKPRKTGQG
ncbi:phage tail assembly protein [Pseudomonas japonica]|uniref:phage tail assembly protein n=1 Tax=Pseudomonas japonica TaxID=256466 RepID=UPI003A8A3654